MNHIIGGSGSSYVLNGYGLAMAVVAAVSLGVGVWVVIRERARRISLSLMVGAFAVAVYLLGFSFLVQATNAGAAHVWAHVAYVGIPLIVPALYQFSIDLLGLWQDRRGLITAAWTVGLTYLVLAQTTELLIPGVMKTAVGYYTELTAWNIPFVAWSVVLLTLVLRDYWNAYSDADRVQRARIRWLAIPLLIASMGFSDYLPSLGVDLPPLGFAFLAAFPLAAAWVVRQYHLPDLTPAFAADQILTTMAEPLLVVDRMGRVSITNPATARLLGWSQEELESTSLAVLLGAETAGRLTDGTALRGMEMELEARTGEPIAVSVSTNALVEKGREVGTVIVARDIRERRRAARRLERREQYFRALIENTRDTISVLDADGRMLYQSPSHADILGRVPGEDVGSTAFGRVHPDDEDVVQRRFAALLAEPGGVERMEVRIRHTDGEYRVLDVRAQNLLDHPAVQGIVMNGRDITEERKLADRLQQSQKLEAIGRLAGGIAHDFNNILTTIQGTVSLMHDEVEPDSELARELDVIGQGATRAGRLTSQLLAFSRRQVTRPEKVDLNELLLDLRSGFEQILGPERRLEIDVAREPSVVRVDHSQLEQALVDLVVNAGDAMDPDGRLQLAVDHVQLDGHGPDDVALEPGPYIRLTVTDDGRGMDSVTQRRIFEPFFTTKENGISEGLGLASVYGVVRQADGHIEVESAPGAGSTFSIYLPRVDGATMSPEGEADADADADGGSGDEGAAGKAGGELVLVVEDERPVRELIRKVLERNGYRVVEAPDGEAALELAADLCGRLDLLIADLVMPGMTGREVAERLTAEEPELATILISGYTADDIVRAGIQQGDYTFIPKPFSPEVLTHRVAEVLRARSVEG